MADYIGISTLNSGNTTGWKVTGIALVKADLTVAFMTKPGERIMRPEWGCKIWNYLFQQGPNIQQNILDEVTRIVSEDPRVTLVNATLTTYTHGVTIAVILNYVEYTDLVDTLYVTFNKNDSIAGYF